MVKVFTILLALLIGLSFSGMTFAKSLGAFKRSNLHPSSPRWRHQGWQQGWRNKGWRTENGRWKRQRQRWRWGYAKKVIFVFWSLFLSTSWAALGEIQRMKIPKGCPLFSDESFLSATLIFFTNPHLIDQPQSDEQQPEALAQPGRWQFQQYHRDRSFHWEESLLAKHRQVHPPLQPDRWHWL